MEIKKPPFAEENPAEVSKSGSTPEKKTLKNFRLGEVIGEGSYGEVRLAKDKETAELFAVKIVEKKRLIRAKKAETVLREKNCLQITDHPFIVRLHHTLQDNTCLYFVMEYCSNSDLLTYIDMYGGLREDCAAFYAAEIIVALGYLRAKGIVHRDLKPENIRLTKDWHIKLIDFGTAKIMGEPVEDNSFCGTAEYVSPEVLKSQPVSYSADLWALGCVIYQMITGFSPFFSPLGEYFAFKNILSGQIIFAEHFPPEAKDLIIKLLNLEPNLRIGAIDLSELQRHPFFSRVDWQNLHLQTPVPMGPPPIPFIPHWMNTFVSEDETEDFSTLPHHHDHHHLDQTVCYEA